MKASEIIDLVARNKGFNSFILKRKTRKREIVEARQIAMKLIHDNIKMTLQQVGDLFYKDHATVLHAKKTIRNLCDTEKDFLKDYSKLESKVKKTLLNQKKQVRKKRTEEKIAEFKSTLNINQKIEFNNLRIILNNDTTENENE